MVVYGEELCTRLEAIEWRSWTGTVYRFTAERQPPQEPNRLGARWNPPDLPTLYAGLTREVALAEQEWRLAALSPRPSRGVFRLHRIRVEIVDVLDLCDERVLEPLGLSNADIASDDHAACRHIGGAAAYVEAGGLIVPSARYRDGRNLVIFTQNQSADFVFQVEGSDALDSESDEESS